MPKKFYEIDSREDEGCSTRVDSWILGLAWMARRDKHSSLFCLFVSDEEKSFIRLAICLRHKTPYLRHWRMDF